MPLMNNNTPDRNSIDPAYKWKLEDIYTSDEQWESDFLQIRELADRIEKFQSKVAGSAATLLQVLQLIEKMERTGDKLYVYARMRRDEDNSNSLYQSMFDRAESLGVIVNSLTAFITPELTAITPEQFDDFKQQQPELGIYKQYFAELWRQQEHILSEAEERLLALTADLSTATGNIFTMLNNADIKFPVIKDEDGKEIELTKGRFGRFMESDNRRVRQDAFKGLYSSYSNLKNTLAVTLASSVKRDIFYARARNYTSALESSLDSDNVSVEVYNKLIDTVHNYLDKFHRYMQLRKKMLQVDELHMYDIYVPLVKEYKANIPYAQAWEILLKGLQPLGKNYIETLQQGRAGSWIDVLENRGKTGGAYSWGTYDTHPYVLLNYDNKLDDVFTLAHEMGHALHSYYSNQTQPFIYSQYSIMVAEVASTVNESLLIDYLLENSNDPREKLYLLNHYLEQFRGTLYRQTMFAEYEKIIHELAEEGEALTTENLSRIYRDLNVLYYGPEVVIDEEINMEWARIPHFYSAFYVYKYATGFSAATALKTQILAEGQPAVDRYLEFLRSGSSDYPLEILKKAGVDLSTPNPVNKALDYFGKLLTEFENVAEQITSK